MRGSYLRSGDRRSEMPRPRTSALLRQAFGLQGFMHLRARSDSSHIGSDIGIWLQIDAYEIGPVDNRERVGVGDREVGTHQVLFSGQLAVQVGEPPGDIGLGRLFDRV